MPQEEKTQEVEQEELEQDFSEFDAAFEEKAGATEEAAGDGAGEGASTTGDSGDEAKRDNDQDYDTSFDSASGDEPAADPKEKENPDLAAELEATKQELERTKQSDRSQRGRVSALSKKLAEQKAATTTEPPKTERDITAGDDGADAGDEDDWEEFERDFPEIASVVNQRISKVEQQQDQTAARVEAVSSTTETMVESELENYAAEQFNSVQDAHGDVEQIIQDPDFIQWRDAAPADIQEKRSSVHAEDAIAILDAYKAHKEATVKPQKTEVEMINERRQQQLQQSAGISLKKIGQAPATAESMQAFDDAFDEGVRAKEKQRTRFNQ